MTILVRRRIKPGRERDDEAWLEHMTRGAADGFPGYQGAESHPPPAAEREYRNVFRFHTLLSLEAFEQSDFRRQMLDKAAAMFAAGAAWERMTGLELWFDRPPTGTRAPVPTPHRMALVLAAAVFCLVPVPSPALGPVMAGWPMPCLTPLIARLIYPQTRIL